MLLGDGRLVQDGKYVQGRDGWLFLDADSNDIFAQHSGSRTFSAEELARWMSVLENRAARLAERGCSYLMLIPPNTHSLYPEKLPANTLHGRVRPVHKLLEAVDQATSQVKVVYPLDEMTAQKPNRPVCSPIDSHWSDFGAFVAYTAVLDQLDAAVSVRRLSMSDVLFVDMIGGGDLGVKLVPPRLGVHQVAVLRYPHAKLVYDNCIENTGSVIVTRCRAAPASTCLLFGDSYSYPLIKFLAESFGRVVLAHSVNFDWNLVDQLEPDFVLSVMSERFLIEVPKDKADLAASERAKRDRRTTRPPQTNWFGERWVSPIDVEILRAHLVAEGRTRDAVIVSLIAYGGLVAQEITSLRWPDVGDHELAIRKRGAKVGQDTPARRVPMMDPLADDLHMYRELHPPATPRSLVFPGKDGLQWPAGEWSAWREQVFLPAVRACGLEAESPLDLRHTYCTLLIHEGVPPKEVARRIGERPRETRHIYRLLLAATRRSEPVEAERTVREARRQMAPS